MFFRGKTKDTQQIIERIQRLQDRIETEMASIRTELQLLHRDYDRLNDSIRDSLEGTVELPPITS